MIGNEYSGLALYANPIVDMSHDKFHVAIVGGGLCGLALAIALTKRKISYTIYEGGASFTELGFGINLGPNTVEAFEIIDPAIARAISKLVTRNRPGKEEVWMDIRFGAATQGFADGDLIVELLAPPTGNTTAGRNELLQLLAQSTDHENAKFNKKLVRIEQSDEHATMIFEDGTQDTASLIVGCDGIHSSVRRCMLGSDHPAAEPQYSGSGAYRSVLAMADLEEAIGAEMAHTSIAWLGPGGYVIHYPINGGESVGVGLWPLEFDDLPTQSWILPKQKARMLTEFANWGETVQRIMSKMSEDQTGFWACFYHATGAPTYFKDRVCVIGDGAHAMPPHQGQGAAQAMEDACVLAEVLKRIDATSESRSVSEQIDAALTGYETVRRPRYEAVRDTSNDALGFWSHFHHPDLADKTEVENYAAAARERFQWIWNADIAGQGHRAVAEMQRILCT